MSTRVLVATASRHGSTLDIGDEIARTLALRGFDVVDRQIGDVGEISNYDGFIIGSAVYAGHWLPHATSFVKRHADMLRTRPVWLFSSGPIGDPPKPEADPQGVADLAGLVSARGHRIFGGNLEPDSLGLGEKTIIALLHAPKGDYRDFDAIRAWTQDVADEMELLTAQPVPQT